MSERGTMALPVTVWPTPTAKMSPLARATTSLSVLRFDGLGEGSRLHVPA
jgi:hypothetical protein